MAMNKEELEQYISEAFPGATYELIDLAGDNDHWSLHITSEEFKGKSRIEQHKLVYNALQGKMGGDLHALQLKTSTP